ncbi:MAG: dihydroorotase [Lachnospiraceae bacterium]|nr:dihydroorotase [Lachnospiraceae bacterium]
MKTLLSNAKVFTHGSFLKTNVLIEDGVVFSLSDSISCLAADPSVSVIDYSGKYIFPGFVDVHVHFREPGFLYKEDIASGSKAAAKGGYTHVFTMPNLNPVPDSIENMNEELKAIHEKACVKVYPYASITKGEKGEELVDFEEMTEYFELLGDGRTDDFEKKASSGTIRLAGFSDDGTGVEDASYMEEAMTRVAALGGIISAHCEIKSILGGKNVHDGVLAKELGYKGISSESEWKMVERDIALSKETGCRYHVCHVSTKESVELIRRAKKEGVDITCETGPHYLLLNDEDVLAEVLKDGLEKAEKSPETENGYKIKYGLGRFKMNPPIRSEEDRKALIEGIKDGTVDMIATDHAPHSLEEKQKGFDGPMGVVGLECAFPVLYTGLVKTGVISLEKLIDLMSIKPSERFDVEHGIAEGMPADLTVYDLDEEYVIDPDTFASKGRFTPFEGRKVFGRCIATYVDGKPVF